MLCQLGVSSRSESQRSRRQEFATSPRSSTVWSIECSARTRLTASPPWPAPMTTVVMRSMARPAASGRFRLDDLDRDARWIGHDIVHGRSFLRLRDERLDVFLGRIGVDMERDLDAVIAIAHIAVDTEDAVQVHLALKFRLHRAQLDAAVLRHGCHARSQATRKANQYEL